MLGSHFGISSFNTLTAKAGDLGVFLHAAGAPLQYHSITAMRNGRLQCDYVNVAWNLRPVNQSDGGFGARVLIFKSSAFSTQQM